MLNIFNELDLRQEHHQAQAIQYVIAFLTNCLIVLNYFLSNAGLIYSLVLLLIFVPFFRFYNRSLSDLVYTYWGLTFFLFSYLIYNFFSYWEDDSHQVVVYLNFLNSTLLAINCYIMASPLFYPRVQWWEYDFRYRADFKVTVEFQGKNYPARLTDLRRGAGCVVAFEDIPLSSDIKIQTRFLGDDIELFATISSKRVYYSGRGTTYGVRFIINNDKDKKSLDLFTKYWQHNSKVKLRNKFKDLA